jgi:hypothetical protein
VKIKCWYRNGSLRAFHDFCIQNRGKSVSLNLINKSEQIRGTIYHHNIDSDDFKGVFLLLTEAATHPAFYCLEDIENLNAGVTGHRVTNVTEIQNLLLQRCKLVETIALASDEIKTVDDRLRLLRSNSA